MVSARESATQLAALLSREHACMADFLLALAEFDRRRAWAELGYTSLFSFLHRRLGLSKGAAFYRKTAAELVVRHPEVIQPLRDGRLCLMSVVELARVIDAANVTDVLPRFFHRSRREAAAVAATIRPVENPPSRAVVTTVPAPPAPTTPMAEPRDTGVVVQPVEPLLRVNAVQRELTVPLAEDAHRIHVTVSKRFLAKLDAARDALSHSHPMASMEAVLEAGLDLLIERHRKRRGVEARARANPRRAAPDRITAAVKREVWERDGGRCQWPMDGGGVCGSTTRLEFDHRVPRGLGGTSGAANVRILCRFHNLHAARQVYGDDRIDRWAPRVPRASEPVMAWRCGASA